MREKTIEREPTRAPRYCDACGYSLMPLGGIHVSRDCGTCGRTVFTAERAADGAGLRVRQGDRLHVPPEAVKLSLDPAAGGRLFRPGLPYLVQTLLLSGQPEQEADLGRLLDHYEEESGTLLAASPALEGLDPRHAQDAAAVAARLAQVPESREGWAWARLRYARAARAALAQGDAHGTGWALYHATAAHALVVCRDPVFEQTLWRGYLASQVVYSAAAGAAYTPAEAEALQKLEPLFSRLDEAVLHTWVESGLPIGPRIGVHEIPEPTLLALARWHLTLFERRREEARRARELRKSTREIWIKGISVGVAAAAAVLTLLQALGVV